MIILILIGLTIILADQALKALVVKNMLLNQVIDLNIIKLEYVQKFANFFDKDLNILVIIISIIFVSLFAFWFLTTFVVNVKNKNNYIPFILVIGGFVANIIDRILFNIADMCIVAGLFLTVIFYLLKINTDDFNTMDINRIEKKEKRNVFRSKRK